MQLEPSRPINLATRTSALSLVCREGAGHSLQLSSKIPEGFTRANDHETALAPTVGKEFERRCDVVHVF
jgi:hypothetical protein